MANNTRYIVLANYTQKAIAGMVQAPTDRAAAVKTICKAAGVKSAAAKVFTPAG